MARIKHTALRNLKTIHASLSKDMSAIEERFFIPACEHRVTKSLGKSKAAVHKCKHKKQVLSKGGTPCSIKRCPLS